MDWCLIGAGWLEWSTWSWIVSPSSWLEILLVALGLGTVIFVHELGHFLVAKLCGVKCEKFYLGFDIAGWKICSFRWGETEYGIGAIPLGGYVKMLGQEDNPARLKEELERAKAAQAAGSDAAKKPSKEDTQPIDVAAVRAALYDPRSYLAKSVPKRMAIISAGVIMNLIFAFFAAVVAYSIGVDQKCCEIGLLQPGDPAWQADLRPGDRMVEINGRPTYRFEDLFARVPLSAKGDGVTMRVERPGQTEPIELELHPNRNNLIPVIGVTSAHTTSLLKSSSWLGQDELKPYLAGTAAARAEPILLPGDKIVKIDGVPVKTGPAVDEALSARRDRPIEITIERKKGRDKPAEELLIHVVPRPMRDLGLVMEMGPVTAIQKGSPAALAGLKPGDRLTALDGSPVGDPLTLGDRLWKQVERAAADGKSPPTVTLTVERAETLDVPVTLKGLQPRDCIVAVDNHSLENQKISVDPLWARVNRALAKGESVPEVTLTVKRRHKLELPVALRRTNAFETPSLSSANGPVSVPSLGVAYKIGNKVAEVVPGGPAAAAGVVPGDVLTAVTIPKPDDALVEREGLKSGDVEEAEFDLKKYPFDWPRVFTNMQMMLPGSKVELTFAKGKKAVLEPVADDDWFNPERGFRFAPLEFKQTAHSFGEALRLGGAETWEQSTVVLRTVQRLASGDLSMKLVGGPITIAQVAGAKASAGLSDFLIFLTMISSMLAVVNFLPIPILDGGHFVFLLYEGIRRKPVSERVQLALSYVGLLLILALMFWALGLDTKLIPRE